MTETEWKAIAAVATAIATVVAAVFSVVVGAILSRRSQRKLEELKASLSQQSSTNLEQLRASLMERTGTRLEELKASLSQQASMNLEQLKASIADRNSAASARRDYEYDARKRLYADIEPILFQLHEALEEAVSRVRSLARTHQKGCLGTGKASWVVSDGYYLRSTIYKIMLPTVFLRIIRRRITFVDLGLDDSIRLRYRLIKLYFRTFTDHFDLARVAPALSYTPDDDVPADRRHKEPAVFSRQGLVLGDLENIADLLVVTDPDGTQRAMLFGEFERLLKSSADNEDVQELKALFRGFSPETKPVLARMLSVQAYLGEVILSTFHDVTELEPCKRLEQIADDPQFTKSVQWSEASTDVAVAVGYLKPRLREVVNMQALLVAAPARSARTSA